MGLRKAADLGIRDGTDEGIAIRLIEPETTCDVFKAGQLMSSATSTESAFASRSILSMLMLRSPRSTEPM